VNFIPGDTIDLHGIAGGTAAAFDSATGTLVVTNDLGATVATLRLCVPKTLSELMT
jgi:hypothetical protein